jgi:hypothetical protein
VIGVSEGWVADVRPEAEDMAAHWQAISEPAVLTEPHSVYDEALSAREALIASQDRMRQ